MLDDADLDALFREARTHNAWTDRPVPDELLVRLYDLVKMGPTSASCSPGRFVFDAHARRQGEAASSTLERQSRQDHGGPVTAIIAYDLAFFDKLPELFPHTDARPWFTSSPAFAEQTAFRNSALQGAYLILAARALGLDTGPMSGFKADLIDEAFFAGTTWRTNFLINLGFGDPSGLFERLPRLPFDQACSLQ